MSHSSCSPGIACDPVPACLRAYSSAPAHLGRLCSLRTRHPRPTSMCSRCSVKSSLGSWCIRSRSSPDYRSPSCRPSCRCRCTESPEDSQLYQYQGDPSQCCYSSKGSAHANTSFRARRQFRGSPTCSSRAGGTGCAVSRVYRRKV
jgi:hypothetical protein